MTKKAARLVAAFLLLDGVFKMQNSDISARIVLSYLSGEMTANDMLKCLFGLKTGCLESKL